MNGGSGTGAGVGVRKAMLEQFVDVLVGCGLLGVSTWCQKSLFSILCLTALKTTRAFVKVLTHTSVIFSREPRPAGFFS